MWERRMDNTKEERLIALHKMDWYSKLKALQDYAEMENTEVGEMWKGLCMMAQSSYDYASKEFQDALEKEVDIQLAYVVVHATIKEEKKTETRTYTSVWLEWDYE